MNTWFISDLHLQDVFERNGQTLLRFLFHLNENPKNNRLVLLGDIFDVWVSDGFVFQDQFKMIIDEIVKLQKNGGEVIYFEGNHDVHIEKFWKKHSVQVFANGADFVFDKIRVRAEHGDYINPNDKKYLKWLSIMRHPLMKICADVLPGFFWLAVAGKYSKKSRKKSSDYAVNNSEDIRKMIRDYARELNKKNNFDLIVTGHMHVKDDFEFSAGDRKVRSINLGTWLQTPVALKLSANGDVQWVELT